MRFYLDTEFHEDGVKIELISIALVAENGQSFYAVSNEFRISDCSSWVQTFVVPHLPHPKEWLSRREIRSGLQAFVESMPWGKHEFWGYYADYDWVVLCQLFGLMIDLPPSWPKYCRDLKQVMDDHGIEREDLPAQVGAEHDALADAQWVRAAHQHILGAS